MSWFREIGVIVSSRYIFCGISNSFVKRNVDGTPAKVATAQPNSVGISGLSMHNSAQSNAPQQNKVQQSSSKVAQKPPIVIKGIKSDSISGEVHDLVTKPSADKEKNISFPSNKKKGQNDKGSTGNGGSLANFWDRASAKPKTCSAPADNSDSIQNFNDAQVSSCEAVEHENSDIDAQEVNFGRASNSEGNRKRRVVFDLSDEDEYEDAVNLASPDPPKRKSFLDSKQNSKTSVPERPDVDKPDKDEVTVKEERTANREPNRSLGEETSLGSKSKNGKNSSSVKLESQLPEIDLKKDKVTDASSNSPKRRKVLKTRIDDRGREVTEVVWEGEETEVKKVESDVQKKASGATNATTNTVTNTNSRPAVAKRSPAVGTTAPSNPGGKTGNKKAGNAKDPKQGNILSFFKKV
ncbi:hypothetical protein ERO13_A04G043100v2 [Gossypium hirsutum]|nr:hypothetical protein ERO13_A04G043100v2 [Gossypium hirsutum]